MIFEFEFTDMSVNSNKAFQTGFMLEKKYFLFVFDITIVLKIIFRRQKVYKTIQKKNFFFIFFQKGVHH